MPLATRNRVLAAVLVAFAAPPGAWATDDVVPANAVAWRGVLFRVVPPADADDGAPAYAPPTSFLLGTMHVGSLDDLALDPDSLRAVLGTTHTLVEEADPEAPLAADLDSHRFLQGGAALPKLIGEPAFAMLGALVPSIPPERLARLKPWAALALLESRGEPPSFMSLDGLVLGWAREFGMPLAYLESLQEQLTALDCVPPREHAQVLAQRLQTPWVFKEETERAFEYYRRRDLPALGDEIDAMPGLDTHARAVEQRARECLLGARNARWIGRLDPLLRAGRCFVAVGVMHLVGEDGLLALLERRGYAINPEAL